MEQNLNAEEINPELDQLKAENRKLSSELRGAKRELLQRDRTISAMENNFNLKLNMSRKLVNEHEKYKLFLSHMMQSSVDFVILLDANLNIDYCSDLFLQKIDAKYIDEIEGKNILYAYGRFASDDLLAKIKKSMDIAIEKNETHYLDVLVNGEKASETRAFRIIHAPIFEDGFKGMLIDWSDTTDITDAKNAVEKANKSSFLATMSHEIRTPLNAIIGLAQIQLHKGKLPDEYHNVLSKIYSSGSNLLGIINDILDLSKIETGKLDLMITEYDLPAMINDAVQLNIVRIGSKEIDFLIEIDETLPLRLLGDELRLKQIMNNLLSNAIKYTEAGQVKLTIDHVREGDEIVLRFSVQDTGQGMKPEDLARLFSEYSRFNAEANRTTEGTGLGLNITQKLVEMMNGSIHVESEYGKGSTFTVEVRQKQLNAARSEKSSPVSCAISDSRA